MAHRSFGLIPSPSWYRPQISDTNLDGLFGYGSSSRIVVFDLREGIKLLHCFLVSDIPNQQKRVLSVSFCKCQNSYLLATSDDAGAVKVWDLTGTPTSVEISKDTGRFERSTFVDFKWGSEDILYVSSGAKLKESSIQKKTCRHFKNRCSDRITLLKSCSSDPNILAAGLYNGTICIFDSQSFCMTHTLYGHTKEIVSLSWCAESNSQLASSSADGTTRFWLDTANERQCKMVNGKFHSRDDFGTSSTLFAAACHPTDPFTVVFSNAAGKLFVWTNEQPPQKVQFPSSNSHYRGLFFLVPCNYDPNVLISFSLDKKLVFWSLKDQAPLLQFGTITGSVNSIKFAPPDNTKLVFACSDKCIRIWNSTKSIDVVNFISTKMKGRIHALSFHPYKEGVFALAVDDGRVGIADVGSTRPPMYFDDRHRGNVYSLSWGPCEPLLGEEQTEEDLFLYSCGGGKVFIRAGASYSEKSVSLSEIITKSEESSEDYENFYATEVSWKPDFSWLAVGFNSGKIHILDGKTFQCLVKLCTTSLKSIYHLRWHPEYVTLSSSSKCSLHCWLACSVNACDIYLFDLSMITEEGGGESEIKMTHVLKGHSDKITQIVWQPHVEGQLASSSSDRTVQIWDVKSAQRLNFICHTSRITGLEWSYLDPDLLFTVSDDELLLQWKVSELDSNATPPEYRQRNRKKAAKVSEASDEIKPVTESEEIANGIEQANKDENEIPAVSPPEVQENGENSVAELAASDPKNEEVEEEESENENALEENKGNKYARKKRKNKKKGQACGMTTSSRYPYSFQKMGLFTKSTKPKDILKSCEQIVDMNLSIGDCDVTDTPDSTFVNFFQRDRVSMFRAVTEEAQYSKESDTNGILSITYAIWNGTVKQTLLDLTSKDLLTDMHVSMAPMVSRDFWLDICEKYAFQLIRSGCVQKAATYFLACNKVLEAINALKSAGLYRDAIAIAKLRFPEGDQILAELFREWIFHPGAHDECCIIPAYLTLQEPLKAAEYAAKKNDCHFLAFATSICKKLGLFEHAEDYALRCTRQLLVQDELSVMDDLLVSQPSLKGLQILIDIYKYLKAVLEKKDLNIGLVSKVFPKKPYQEDVPLWHCLRVGGRSYLQVMFDLVFLDVEPGAELTQMAVRQMLRLCESMKNKESPNEVIVHISLNIALFLCSTRDLDPSDVVDNGLEYLNAALLCGLQEKYAMRLFHLIFPFDIMWNSQERAIKVDADSEDMEGPVDVVVDLLIGKIASLPVFQKQQFLGNVDFLQKPSHIMEPELIEMISGYSPIDSMLVYMALYLVHNLKEHLLKRETWLICKEPNVTEEVNVVIEVCDNLKQNESDVTLEVCDNLEQNVNAECDNPSVVENGCHLDQDNTKEDLGVAVVENGHDLASESNETNSDGVSDVVVTTSTDDGTAKELPTELQNVESHLLCCDISELFMTVSYVIGACLCKDIFAMKQCLKEEKDMAEKALLALKVSEGHGRRAATVLATNANKTELAESAAKENGGGNRSIHPLEEKYNHLLNLLQRFNNETQGKFLLDSIPHVIKLKAFYEENIAKIQCPTVETTLKAYCAQLKIWLQKFVYE